MGAQLHRTGADRVGVSRTVPTAGPDRGRSAIDTPTRKRPVPGRRRPRRAPTAAPTRGTDAAPLHDRSDAVDRSDPPAVSVLLPTYNEAENIVPLLDRIATTMAGLAYEVLVVDDDSPDETWRVATVYGRTDPRVRVIRRLDERGLSSAVLTGMAASAGRTLVVMDADLQHDEAKIPDLVSAVEAGADVCLGSREAEGGGYGSFTRRRRLASRTGAILARGLLGVPVSDPMSGFFAVSRQHYELLAGRINPRGFKILLEFLARGPQPTVAEVGYVFGERFSGTTKLNGSVVAAYLLALADLAVRGRLARRRADRSSRSVSAGGR